MKYAVLITFILSLVSCKKNPPPADKLGVVTIEVSGDKDAIPHFEKGLLLLHSFEYEDAREAFDEAIENDPNMPMAYWGKAMTYNHSLWSEQDFDDAVAVLE